MDWINAHIQLVLFAWVVSGILAWGWMSYSIEQVNPAANRTSMRWIALVAAIFGGLIFVNAAILILSLGQGARMGLRFK